VEVFYPASTRVAQMDNCQYVRKAYHKVGIICRIYALLNDWMKTEIDKTEICEFEKIGRLPSWSVSGYSPDIRMKASQSG
jgi:hypothetical protein